MPSQREIVCAGVDIICQHLLCILYKLKRQCRPQSRRRWRKKRKYLEWIDAKDFHPSRRSKNDCSIMSLHTTQVEHGDNNVLERDDNPLTGDRTMQVLNIKREVKQEIEDVPESLCNDHGASTSFVNQVRTTSAHVSENVHQFATLCEVYMPPSPSGSNELHSGCDDTEKERLPDGDTAIQNIRSLKREVSSLRMQLANVESGVRNFLGDDQLLYLSRKSSQDLIWSDATIRKAKEIQSACGVMGYNRLCEMGFPLPDNSTVALKTGQFSAKHMKKICVKKEESINKRM